MHALDMVGATEDGTGFGNLSARSSNTNRFYITGTATGKHPELTKNHYCLVTDYDIRQNRLSCRGPVRASAESMTHAAIYESAPDVGAVYHIHHKALWRSMLDKELRSSLQKETIEERLDEILENVSLKNVPLEERRKEANKPLYLTRYE